MNKKHTVFLWKQLQQHVSIFIVIFALVMFSSLLTFLLPLLNQQVIDAGLMAQDFKVLVLMATLIFTVHILLLGISVATRRLSSRVKNDFDYQLTARALKKYLSLRSTAYTKGNFTQVMDNTRMDVRNISLIADEYFLLKIISIFKIIGGLLGLFLINNILPIILILIIPLKFLLTVYFTKKRKEAIAAIMKAYQDYATWYGDRLKGIHTIRHYGLRGLIMKQFNTQYEKVIDENKNIDLLQSVFMNMDSLLLKFTEYILYLIGGIMIFAKALTIGEFFAFITYTYAVITPISSLINIKYDLSKVSLGLDRYLELMDREEEYQQEANLETVKIAEPESILEQETLIAPLSVGNLCFEDVTFSYDDENPILHHFSASIRQGEKIGIVGENGSGKSTLFKLLLKDLDPQKGSIKLGPHNLHHLGADVLRSKVCIIPQETDIFHDTLWNNLTLFDLYKQDPKALENLAKTLQLEQFLKDLPQGFDTVLGSSGSTLSGGQKQRLSIMRGLLKEADIYLFDEHSSSLDLLSEVEINKSLLTLLEDKTALFISHRPDILQYMDKVIFLEKGKLCDFGTHEDLTKNNKQYRHAIKVS